MDTVNRGLRAKYQEKVKTLIERERQWTCGAGLRVVHSEGNTFRFQKLLEVCRRYVPLQSAAVLDIGRSNLTRVLASYYRTVTTLGFDLSEDDGGHREASPLDEVPHIVFDLNHSSDVESWPERPQAFDLIVYSEAIEHIHIAPELSLLMLSWLLKEHGKIVVSTPNAATITNRRRLLKGRNPFERLRYYDKNPGHFREYTRDELRHMAEVVELTCLEIEFIDFRRRRPRLFPSWRESLIAVYEKPRNP